MKHFYCWLLAILCLSSWAHADSVEFGPPKGPVILTVSGDIGVTNQDDGTMVFDLDMLRSLPNLTLSTDNPWKEGKHSYQGFSAIDLLDAIDASGDMLRITALNYYITEVPISDFNQFGTIIAHSIDGRTMSVRTKGPLMVVYDFDDHPQLRSETYYGRSIWQIQSIEVFNSED
ncbi:hypothetical protein DN730_04485 [Marinomonas piezotolerans]|uniref:Oxidoreductase molybdopterin-binding domain-containing protein n=1 Tax=Marinomonas piezotolerans TaxID=2213058 RepID=A0A370UAW6_9GAMM|nr:hypothetical protein [Marinomonas piezotolerans]RDL44879.1 hypothetical protein DN730_04485 [Marinomonas piezotolerans]